MEDECGSLIAQVRRRRGDIACELFYPVYAEGLDNYVFRAIFFLRFLCSDVARDQVAQGQEMTERIIVCHFLNDFFSIIKDVRIEFSRARIGCVGALDFRLDAFLQRDGDHQKQRTIRAI